MQGGYLWKHPSHVSMEAVLDDYVAVLEVCTNSKSKSTECGPLVYSSISCILEALHSSIIIPDQSKYSSAQSSVVCFF